MSDQKKTDALDAALAERKRRCAAGEPAYRTPREQLAARPHSLRLAISAKCWDCVGGELADGGYHQAVRACPATRCPLHAVRTWQ